MNEQATTSRHDRDGRFALPGRQSGNPLSPHCADQLPAYSNGREIRLAWSEPEVAAATRVTLRLATAPPPPD